MRWTRLLKSNLLNENSLGEPISDNEHFDFIKTQAELIKNLSSETEEGF